MAKKRANGEGSIRKRADGRWEGRYTAGHDADGKRIIKNVLGKTQAEVREKLQKKMAEAAQLDMVRADSYTLGEWIQVWYKLYSEPNIRESTQDYYKRFIHQHIIPKLGDVKLNKLTTREIQKFYNDLHTNGRVREAQKDKNPGLSVAYIKGVHRVLHSCLDRAVMEELILRNPSDACVLPKEEKPEMKVLPVEQIGSYLKAADERGLLPMFYLELITGLRKGELVALQWYDLDEARKTISVNKQYLWRNGKGTISRPKTKTSIRTISIPQVAVDLLKQEHAKHPDNLNMFPSPMTGGMYHPDSIVNLHKKILKDAGLDYVRFHDLRHTFATTALQNGVDIKTVSSMLGHSSAGFTLNTYTHATSKAQEEAAETMGNFMRQKICAIP